MRSRKVTRFVLRIAQSLCILTGVSASMLAMHPSNFKAVRKSKLPISRLREFTRSHNKASYRILKRRLLGVGSILSKIAYAITSSYLVTAGNNWVHFLFKLLHGYQANIRGTLKRKCLHFDEIFITGCTGSCQNDNFQCSQWLKFRQNDDIFVSVYILPMYCKGLSKLYKQPKISFFGCTVYPVKYAQGMFC